MTLDDCINTFYKNNENALVFKAEGKLGTKYKIQFSWTQPAEYFIDGVRTYYAPIFDELDWYKG